MDYHYDYKFFSTSHTSVLKNIENEFEIDLTDRNLYYLGMSKYPDENFMFSEPIVMKLSQNIERALRNQTHTFELVLDLTTIQS